MRSMLASTFSLAFLCTQNLSWGADAINERLRACAAEPDDAKRLACYDVVAGRSSTGNNEDLGVTGELLKQKQREAGVRGAVAQDLHAKVVAIVRPRADNFVVTLDNGQVWRQVEAVEFSLEVGDVVTIRRGLLGALYLANGNHRVETLVNRVK